MTHCTAADLTASPAQIPHRPVFYQDAFDPEGTIDINLVTWHELAERQRGCDTYDLLTWLVQDGTGQSGRRADQG